MTLQAHHAADAAAQGGGIRELINRHSGLAAAAVAAVVVLCLTINLWPEPKPEAYYTTDDGKTFFAAGPNIPPFEHEAHWYGQNTPALSAGTQ